ncbi:MAG: hypothetical protein ACYDH5_14400 [Acidimicrobiales bacterium]
MIGRALAVTTTLALAALLGVIDRAFPRMADLLSGTADRLWFAVLSEA